MGTNPYGMLASDDELERQRRMQPIIPPPPLMGTDISLPAVGPQRLGERQASMETTKRPTADVQAPIALPDAKVQSPFGQAQMPAVKAPRGTTEGDQAYSANLLAHPSAVSQIQGNVENSGFGQRHPGWGKVLGGLAQFGGALGESLIPPGIAARMPDTTIGHNVALGHANAQVAADTSNAEKQAQAEAFQAQVPLREARAQQAGGANETKEDIAAGTNETKEKIAEENNDTKEDIASKKLTPEAHDAFHEWMKNPNDYVQFEKAMTAAKAKPSGGGGGSSSHTSMMSIYAAVKGLQLAYTHNPDLLPVLGPVLQHLFAQQGVPMPADAGQILGGIPLGQPLNSATGKPIGTSMPEAPTGSTRSRGQFAGEVLPTMHDAAAEIDKIGDKLGPFMGRVSSLVTGKVGAYGPEFSALQTDLHNIATGWGRLHGNSVETMKQFYEDLDSSKDPANLKAKLERYEKQAETYRTGGTGQVGAQPGNQPGAGAPPPRPASVPEDYSWNPQGNGGKGSWQPPKTK